MLLFVFFRGFEYMKILLKIVLELKYEYEINKLVDYT